MRPAIVDTSVVVAGLLSANPESPVSVILDGMLAGRVPFVLSMDLLDEYRRVLLRPKIRQRHGLTPEQIDYLLTAIVANAIIREPARSATAPDPGDDHLWALLRDGGNAILVTGDLRLIEEAPEFGSVVTARSFVEILTRTRRAQ
jgi:putative PIN family toxin of toxin-antitoxin system